MSTTHAAVELLAPADELGHRRQVRRRSARGRLVIPPLVRRYEPLIHLRSLRMEA
ncbi:hypothetical protein WME89_00420 [Sorangium sp. So ce321]|uniref:hypothetical protein n=1 Tax=Sorangium sp. So ce321 TaxID=3133300 RepID=UPI003F61022B